MQVESNGVLSVPENHCSEVDKCVKRNSLKKFLDSEEKQLLLEFNEDQVRLWIWNVMNNMNFTHLFS